MLEVEQRTTLPRLLDLDNPPSVTQRRRYWRYVHRWRRRLFHLWRKDIPGEADGLEIARGVDDLLAIVLLLDYFRRSGHADLPPISEIHERLSPPWLLLRLPLQQPSQIRSYPPFLIHRLLPVLCRSRAV